MNETNERTNSSNALERAPSALSTDCPIETCLEFSVVDYWGNPVTSPSKFELDGKPVQPDTPIFNLVAGPHILKAIDGEDLRKEIINFPYEPLKFSPFPAEQITAHNNYKYIPSVKDKLWQGIVLTTSPRQKCSKYLIDVTTGLDYYILLVFLDHHSGELHGTGHAAAIIINGETNDGMFTHFGPYADIFIPAEDEGENSLHTTVGEVQNEFLPYKMLINKNGPLNEFVMETVFSYVNEKYASGINSKIPCYLKAIFNGPLHANMGYELLGFSHLFADLINIRLNPDRFFYIPSGFDINGLVAWALYALPKGSYARMQNYINNKYVEMKKLQDIYEDGYKIFSFNCMTYALELLSYGIGKKGHLIKQFPPDHPNGHIQAYMLNAHDSGIFDERLSTGNFEAVTKKEQIPVHGLHQHQQIKFAYSNKLLYAKKQ